MASHHSAPVSDPLLQYSSNSSDNCRETQVFFLLRDPPLVPSESLIATFFPLAMCLGEMLAPGCYCWEDNYLKFGMLEHIPGRARGKWGSAGISPTPLYRWAHHISDFGIRRVLRGCILVFSLAGQEEGPSVETPHCNCVFLFASSCSKSVPIIDIEVKTGNGSSGFPP